MSTARILHLEDDASDALLTRRVLERAGIAASITVAGDADDYARALAGEDFDLILSDNCIHGFGSLGALQAARIRSPGIPFICVSGAWENKDIDALLAAGATCCVQKSRPAVLIAAVNQALEHQRLRKETARLTCRQAASNRLVAAVQELSLARSIDAIREIVRRTARALTGADGATFVLREGDQCHYVDEDAISPLWKGARFPLSQCISGWVMLNRQPAAIGDIYADPRIPADAYRPTFVKSLVMVPIRAADPIGAIGNYWAAHHNAEPHEIELLQALANTTAVAMENVRVYEKLEQRIRERTRQLEAANRDLESFSFSVSHDLRSPLHNIGVFAELLSDSQTPPTESEHREYLDHIRSQTGRMTHLIEDFLRLARLGRTELKPEPVDLVAIALEILPQLRTTWPNRKVTFVHPPALPASGDRGLLGIVMENLLSNAWKYTGRRESDCRVELGRCATERSPQTFFVRDNGAGFDPQYAGKLFAPFQRLHTPKEFPGSGVGLATVHRIIIRHGGQIWAESSPGQGATFYFTLAADHAV